LPGFCEYLEEHTVSDGSRFNLTIQLVLGAAIAVLGSLFLLDNLNVLHAREYIRFWPIVFVLVGLSQLANARSSNAKVGGLFWLILGVAILGNRFGLVRWTLWDYWPLVLILVGGRIVWHSLHRGGSRRSSDSGSTAPAIAVMASVERRFKAEPFAGNDLTAFMGGGKLDLRESTMAGDRAVINVFSVMGGFEILVPETWSVSLEVTPIMSGIEDKTRHRFQPGELAPHLVVRGFLLMSGVEIKN
jgi:predicted membrane protein